jgi:LiaF transmembrane domain/LiaI-LiaF-like transmembrane region
VRVRFPTEGVVGAVLVLLGILFTLQNFGVLSLGDVLFWPLLIVAFGLSRVFDRRGRIEGLVLLLAGVVVQLSNLGLFALPANERVRYWPLAVLLAGLSEVRSFQNFRTVVEGFVIVSLGAWLQLSYFGLVHIASYRAWPLGLAAVGVLMLWRSLGSRTRLPVSS